MFLLLLPWQRIGHVKLVTMKKCLKFDKNERHKSTYTRDTKLIYIYICTIVYVAGTGEEYYEETPEFI